MRGAIRVILCFVMSMLWFTVSFPADREGFVGRACRAPKCRRYFKIESKAVPKTLHCPYCGEGRTVASSHTPEQMAYAGRVLEEKATKYVHDEVQRMFERAFSGSKHLKFTPGPRYIEKPVRRNYSERKVDTDLTCPDCSYRFKVDGIFGFCPRCRVENAQIYDTNLAMIRKNLAAEAAGKSSALRHAYGDLVSAVEIFCRAKVSVSPAGKPLNFQRLDDISTLALERAGKPLDALLSPEQHAVLKTVYQKRHVNTHNGGVIDARYVKTLPASAPQLGQHVQLSLEEFDAAVAAVKVLFAALFAPPGSMHALRRSRHSSGPCSVSARLRNRPLTSSSRTLPDWGPGL